MTPLEAQRLFYARLVTGVAGIPPSHTRLISVFSETPREHFVGPGPWRIRTKDGYIDTPNDDAALLYQDILVALREEGGINNGQPSLHAMCLAALNVQQGETAIHVGAGTGYYTAMLSMLVEPDGLVVAYEIEPELAERARANLAGYQNVRVVAGSGSEGALPLCDVIYVNAGATGPTEAWLDALRPGGRLLFPLTPDEGFGAMLLVTRSGVDGFEARFICSAMFIPCIGARDEETARTLAAAFRKGTAGQVRSLRRGGEPDESVWCGGRGWWLSTSPVIVP